MIRYSLICANDHGFDGWFRSSADYDTQAGNGHLLCPVCGTHEVGKAMMTPAVSTPAEAPKEQVLLGDKEAHLREMIRKLRAEVTKNAENVGPRFAEVARQMHDGEVERSSVYGVASQDEVRNLREEGIEFYPLPHLPEEGN